MWIHFAYGVHAAYTKNESNTFVILIEILSLPTNCLHGVCCCSWPIVFVRQVLLYAFQMWRFRCVERNLSLRQRTVCVCVCAKDWRRDMVTHFEEMKRKEKKNENTLDLVESTNIGWPAYVNVQRQRSGVSIHLLFLLWLFFYRICRFYSWKLSIKKHE